MFTDRPHSCKYNAGGRLFQQYLCDAYAKIESERLRWVLQNQSMLRRETLQGLVDYLAAANDTDSLSAASLPPAQEHISAPLHPPPLPPTESVVARLPPTIQVNTTASHVRKHAVDQLKLGRLSYCQLLSVVVPAPYTSRT